MCSNAVSAIGAAGSVTGKKFENGIGEKSKAECPLDARLKAATNPAG
jgi:hypothetical protein